MAEILRNDFKPFATDPAAQVMSQAQWNEGMLRIKGHAPGLANQYMANKVERQASLFASALALFINRAGLNAIDDGDENQLANAFQAAVVYFAQEMLYELLDMSTAGSDEAILVGYNRQLRQLFGYPLYEIVSPIDDLYGGNPSMAEGDYADGNLFGGNPTMTEADYTDGNLYGGNPLTI
jgi:hypothetical protein